MYAKKVFQTLSALTLSLCAGGLFGGCGSPIQEVLGSAQIDNLSQGLALQNVTLSGLFGLYQDGTCLDPNQSGAAKRPSNSNWAISVPLSAGSNPTVVLNDDACRLQLGAVGVRDSLGDPWIAQPVPGLPFALGQNFMVAPARFVYLSPAPKEFYLNAKLTPDDFSSDFKITVVYSDTPQLVTPPTAVNVQYATVTVNQVVAEKVPAPDYVMDFQAMVMKKDASLKVVQVGGHAVLVQNLAGQAGEGYTIAPGSCPSALDDVRAAYGGGSSMSIMPTAAALGLAVGATLPLSTCLIVSHADATGANLSSYQLFQIVFN